MTGVSLLEARSASVDASVRQEPPSRQEWIDKAHTVAEVAAAEAERTERDRRVSPVVMAALHESGLLRLMQPIERGGCGALFSDYIDIIEIIASGDGSVGWVYCVLAGHSGEIARMPQAIQDDIWGDDPLALASSAYAPTGRLVPVEDGYMLDGVFPFSSGCDHAQWGLVGAMAADRPGVPVLVCVPMAQLEVIDDWETLGLRGTGSKTLRARDIHVPAHRVGPMQSLEGTPFPLALATAMLGNVTAAVHGFVEEVRGKSARRPGMPRPAESELMQLTIAQALAECDAAMALLKRDVQRGQQALLSGRAYPLELRAELRAMSGLIVRLATQAIDRVYLASGSSPVYNKSTLQRKYRDAHTAFQHFALSPDTAFRQGGLIRMAPEKYVPSM